MEINSKRDLARFIIDKIMTIHEIVFSLSSTDFAEFYLQIWTSVAVRRV